MRTPAQARADRKDLMRSIARDLKAKAKQKLADLRQAVRDARTNRRTALTDAKTRCKTERLAARERAKELRRRAMEELRAAVANERAAARADCSTRRTAARGLSSVIERQRGELAAERAYQADLRRIEAANRRRAKDHPHSTHKERRQESDEEVRTNIPDELVPLWNRVKRSIKGNDRKTRTEAFLQYAEEHPSEVLEGIDERTDALIRDLERQQREARREVKRARPRPPPPSLPPTADGSVPF